MKQTIAKEKKFSYPINQVLGIIMGGGQGTRLYPLTKGRSKPAVPFAGNYRIIDIPISNCINSGVNRVFVLTQYNSASLNRHIIQTYKLDIFHNGFIDILASEQTPSNLDGGFSQGTADAVRKSLKHLRDYRDARYALIMSGDQLYRMNFRDLLANHVENKAQITMGVLPVPEADLPRFGVLKMDAEMKITNFLEKPKDKTIVPDWEIPNPKNPKKNNYLGSMGMYLFNLDVLEEALLKNPNMMDFGKELIPYCIVKYATYGFMHEDYWEDIGTIASYHSANMELTRNIPVFDFYEPSYPIFSKPRFLSPTKIVSTHLENVLLSDGVILEAKKISRCVVGIRSVIRQGSEITDSVIIGADFYETEADRQKNKQDKIPDVGIGENCVIKNAIIDKNCRIGNNVRIENKKAIENLNEENYSIVDGIVVVHKEGVIPDGAVI